MEDVKRFYTLVDKVGELLGQTHVPIVHLTDAIMGEEVGDMKAALVLVRNNIGVGVLSKIDEGPGEPYKEEDIPKESAEEFLSWFQQQPANKQFFLYVSGMSHAADGKLGFAQRQEMGEDAPDPFKETRCYAILYDFNWESDTGYKEVPNEEDMEIINAHRAENPD